MADVNISKYRASVVREGSKPATPGFVVSEGQDPVNPPGTNNFVPYSGATSNVELGEFGLETGFINLDTTPTGTPTTQGTIFWDADDETVDIILNGYTMKIGEDLFYPVKNQTGSTIAKGVAVRFAGTLGASGRLLIEPFIANGTVPSSRFMGVTAEEILNGEDGKVLYFGRVRGINTDAFNEGDILYASTTVAGGYQTAIPLPPNNIVQVAAVISKSATVGTIFVRPTLGSNINTDEGVKITSVADKNLLQYQSGTALWENKTLAQVLGGTSSQFVKGDGSLDSTSYQPLLTNPVTGTGTTNYLPKFTGASTIGNSNIQDSGSVVTISGTSAINGESRYNLIVSDNTAVASGNGGGIIFRGLFSGVSTVDAAGINTFKNNSTSGDFGYGLNLTTRANGGDLTSRLVITSGGNVLIGTTSDNGARLQVSGGITALNSLVVTSSSNAALIASTNSTTGFSYLDFINSGASGRNYQIGVAGNGASSGYANNLYFDLVGVANIMTLTSGRNVLIGTQTDNGARLQVSGRLQVVGSFNDQIRFGTNTSVYTNISMGSGFTTFDSIGGDSGAYSFRDDGQTRMFIDSSGNVGIGTPSPSQALSIGDGTSTKYIRVQGSVADSYLGSDSVGTFLGNNSNAPLYINTNGIERMRITSGGNVGIGTSSPNRLLHLSSASDVYMQVDRGGITSLFGTDDLGTYIGQQGNNILRFITNATERMRITSGGEVLIGNTDNGAYNLQCNGTGVWGAGAYVNGSDRNIKDNIATIEKGLEYIQKMNPVKFRYKPNYTRDHSMQTGFIAQELQEVFASEDYLSGLVQQGVHLSVAYQNLLPVLVKAIQELKQEIDTLKN